VTDLVCLKVVIGTSAKHLITAYRDKSWELPARYTFDFDIHVRGEMACSSGVQQRI